MTAQEKRDWIGMLVAIALAIAIGVMIVSIFRPARAATLCEPQRVTGDKHYWSYRIIDGRACWYRGHPGKPKSELRWGVNSPSRPVEQPVGSDLVPLRSDSAAPTLTEDRLLESTCCWPDLEQLRKEVGQ